MPSQQLKSYPGETVFVTKIAPKCLIQPSLLQFFLEDDSRKIKWINKNSAEIRKLEFMAVDKTHQTMFCPTPRLKGGRFANSRFSSEKPVIVYVHTDPASLQNSQRSSFSLKKTANRKTSQCTLMAQSPKINQGGASPSSKVRVPSMKTVLPIGRFRRACLHRLNPLVAFTSDAYFLHNGRRWQWICEYYTANFKGIFWGP